ncbi:MAG: nitrilase-related carbon-nitrogen hydrolase [Elusimicrobiota bacterium]
MTSNLRARRFVPWCLAVVSGLMLAASFEPVGLGPLAWFALVPLLWAVSSAEDAKAAANLGAVAGLVFYAFSLVWLVKIFGAAAPAFWCLFALSLALYAALLKRLESAAGAGALWVLLAGVVWTGIEYFRSELWWLECSWLALGYSQIANLPVLQSISVWGLYGLSGLIAAANAAAMLLLKGKRTPAYVMIGVLSVTFILGRQRIRELPVERGPELSVALVQDESFDAGGLAALSLRPGAREADLLVWPEYAFAVRPGREERYRKMLADKLRDSRSVAVIGAAAFPEAKGDRMRNYSWVLAPGGASLGSYDKLHPVPYVEHNLPANPDPRPVDTPLGRLGLQICYDLDFEDGVRAMVRQGAQLLVVTNLDPMEWGAWEHAQHSAMSPARAVESGLWIARAASSGVSQIIDPLGRVRGSLPAGESGVLLGKVRLARAGTPYTAWGWLIAPLCLALTMLLGLPVLLRRTGELLRRSPTVRELIAEPLPGGPARGSHRPPRGP